MMQPLMKLGTLALRTLSKPIASRLNQQAGVHRRFCKLIVNLAQRNHRFTTTLQRNIYDHSIDVEIRPLIEEKAVQAAADLIGDLFVFSVAVVVIFEVQRSSRAEAKKDELRRQEIEGLRKREEDTAKELEHVKQKLIVIEKHSKGWGLSCLLHEKEPSHAKVTSLSALLKKPPLFLTHIVLPFPSKANFLRGPKVAFF